jgi:2-methylisocitrate lyase-like PEP mutase family enzyme
MNDQNDEAHFRALHERPGALLLPNPGIRHGATARPLDFEALATTSLGVANRLGKAPARRDPRDAICASTSLALNADSRTVR